MAFEINLVVRGVRSGGRLGLPVALAAVLVCLAVPAAGEEPPGGVLLDEIGPGWVPGRSCEMLQSTASGPIACFEHDGDTLAIYQTDVGPGVNTRDLLGLSPFTGRPLPVEALDGATGHVVSDEPGATGIAIVVASVHHLFTVVMTSPRSAEQIAPFAVRVAARQQARAGGPPPLSQVSPEDERRAAKLDRFLIRFPPETGVVELKTATVRQTFDDLRPIAHSQRVVDLLNGSPVRHRIFVLGQGRFLIVTLDEQPFSEFAAIALGGYRDAAHVVDRRTVRGLEDAVGFRLRDADQYGVAFRRGRFIVNVTLGAPGIEQGQAAGFLDEVAARQAMLLPPGGTSPYFFPSTTRSLTFTVIFTTMVCLVAVGVLRLLARRRRVPTGPAVEGLGVPGDVIDVSGVAAGLRRRGLVLVVGQVVAVNLVVVGVLGLLGAIDIPRWAAVAFVAAGLAGGVAFTSWRARSELAATGAPGGPRRGSRPSTLSVGAAIAAAALLVSGMALAATGLAGFVFGPSLSGLERSKSLHFDPGLINMLAVLLGVGLLVCAAFTVRLARMWARTSATRLRTTDRRDPILYLRSFDDDTLPLPAVVTARRPFLEMFLLRGSDPFEEAVAWELAPYGPVVAIGRPGRPLASLGAARDHLPQDDWQTGVSQRISEAKAVAVVLGSSEGVAWEITQLVTTGALARTVLLFPPTDPATLADRWTFTVGTLRTAGVTVPPLPSDPARTLTVVLDSRHQWHVTTSAVRDEASYRAAIDQAMVWLGQDAANRRAENTVPPAPDPSTWNQLSPTAP